MLKYLFSLVIIPQILFAQLSTQKEIQRALIKIKNGDTLFLPETKIDLNGTLSLEEKENVVIIGAGMDKSILSFKNQSSGAEGFRVANCKNIKLMNFAVEDAKGDCIKTMNVNGISFIKIRTEWTAGPKPSNGGYGLYPVQCQNVLIDACVAIAASDAGIYVGQSKNIEVKNAIAHHNVAGIEIENSTDATVHHCKAYQNAGGILIFDLPDLEVKKGMNTAVFENEIYENNQENFAPKGNIVAKVPQGTGVLILAAHNTTIHHNKIINNKSVGVGVISYYMTENPIKDMAYDPYPSGISIKQNYFERKREKATKKGRMGQMFTWKLRFGKNVPHIIFDGILNEKMKAAPHEIICLSENTNQSFVNIDAGNNFKHKTKDAALYICP
jgi:parallel beta-helix repeat protein